MVGKFNFGKNGAEKVYYILPIFRIIAKTLLNSRDARRVRPHVQVCGCAGFSNIIVVDPNRSVMTLKASPLSNRDV